MNGDIVLDKEFVKSLLFLMHGLMEGIINSDYPPSEARKLLDYLHATERFYFKEANQRELA